VVRYPGAFSQNYLMSAVDYIDIRGVIVDASTAILIATIYYVVVICLMFLELVKPVPQTGTVKGTVSYGGDVEGVTMTLEKDGVVVASVITDATGAYAFQDALAIGDYLLKAHKDTAEGFLTAEQYISVIGGENVIADLPLVKTSKARAHPKTYFNIKSLGIYKSGFIVTPD
jgi:hypothetical protein